MSIADVGKAENQPVSVEVMEVANEEIARLQKRLSELEQYNGEKDERVRELGNCNVDLNRQVDGLEHRLENQARTIKVQSETIARLERQLQCAGNEKERSDWLLWWGEGFEEGKRGEKYMDKLAYWETWAHRILGDLLAAEVKDLDGATASASTHRNAALVFLHKIFCGSVNPATSLEAEILREAYEEMRILCAIPEPYRPDMPPQAPTSPKESPLVPETANVPGEPKPVHPAPNVTIAGGE